jgi:hypothetical protein
MPIMVLVAKGGDRQIDALRTVLGRLGFRIFDRPSRVAILLAQFGGLALPVLGNASFLDVLLFGLGVAQLGRRAIVFLPLAPLRHREVFA